MDCARLLICVLDWSFSYGKEAKRPRSDVREKETAEYDGIEILK
jgi:hypothetical protein